MSAARQPSDIAASVRARLLNLSRQRNVEFQLVLSDFAIERLLYRLGVSPHVERFVLKGAILFKLWSKDGHRATWDLDLLGSGAGGVANMITVVKDLCSIQAEDGIIFDPRSLVAEEIGAANEYEGVRVRLEARLAEARIPMQVDIGFGDVVTPRAVREAYPTLLDHPSPRVLVYSREAVVAEKLEAIISLGVTNSRMKDFFDVYLLASSFAFEGPTLAARATFERRGTPFPEREPLVLTREFLAAPERQTQWRAFLRRGRLAEPPDATEMADALMRFSGPVMAALVRSQPFSAAWPPAGPWTVA